MIRWSTWNLWSIGPGLEVRTDAAIATLVANYPVATREPSARIDYLLAGPTPSGTMPDVHTIGRLGDAALDRTWASDHAGVSVEFTL